MLSAEMSTADYHSGIRIWREITLNSTRPVSASDPRSFSSILYFTVRIDQNMMPLMIVYRL